MIPAAGEGRRMKLAFPGVPKALVPLAGRPMLVRLLETVWKVAPGAEVVVVVSRAVESEIKAALGGRRVAFALQQAPRGTGDAVRSARGVVGDKPGEMLIVFPDQPLISARTLATLFCADRNVHDEIAMATIKLDDFCQWRSAFLDWGRVIRASDGRVRRVVEARDATAEQRAILEVNPSLYRVPIPWVWSALEQVSADNAQGEFLLTDIIEIASRDRMKIGTVPILDPREALGANTVEQLELLEELLLRAPAK